MNAQESFEENMKRAYLKVTSYLYEEALLFLRQEVQESGFTEAVINEAKSYADTGDYERAMNLIGIGIFTLALYVPLFSRQRKKAGEKN